MARESKRLFVAIGARCSSVISRLRQWYAVPVVLLLNSISFGGCSLVSAAVICFSRSGFFGLLGCCLFRFAGMSVTLVWCFSAREFFVHLVHSRRE